MDLYFRQRLHWATIFSFEYCLDFYNWFRGFLHCWIRKWHPFLFIRSGFFVRLIWKKSDLLTKSIAFLWHYQLIFVNTYHPKYVFKRKKCFANNIYWLPNRNIDCLNIHQKDRLYEMIIQSPKRRKNIWFALLQAFSRTQTLNILAKFQNKIHCL